MQGWVPLTPGFAFSLDLGIKSILFVLIAMALAYKTAAGSVSG